MKIKFTLISLLFISSCASIFGKSNYPVAITSSPQSAKFVIENEYGVPLHSGTTPMTVNLNSSSSYFTKAKYKVKFSKEGHEEKMTMIEPTISGWYWGNILIGGVIGMLIVDPATGAMYKLPNVVSVGLDTQSSKHTSR